MKRFACILSSILAMSACGVLPMSQREAPVAEPIGDSEETRPAARPAAVKPPANAQTAEQFDTTTAEERAAAVEAARSASTERDLGSTIASLGAVSEPGIWMKTPLVSNLGKGRVEYPEKGTSVVVDLIPLDAEPGSGSRLSLAAMRLLEADLTGLPEVRVFATGG